MFFTSSLNELLEKRCPDCPTEVPGRRETLRVIDSGPFRFESLLCYSRRQESRSRASCMFSSSILQLKLNTDSVAFLIILTVFVSSRFTVSKSDVEKEVERVAHIISNVFNELLQLSPRERNIAGDGISICYFLELEGLFSQ